jgi:hypothetical protein
MNDEQARAHSASATYSGQSARITTCQRATSHDPGPLEPDHRAQGTYKHVRSHLTALTHTLPSPDTHPPTPRTRRSRTRNTHRTQRHRPHTPTHAASAQGTSCAAPPPGPPRRFHPLCSGAVARWEHGAAHHGGGHGHEGRGATPSLPSPAAPAFHPPRPALSLSCASS